jgi:hypothetical protein
MGREGEGGREVLAGDVVIGERNNEGEEACWKIECRGRLVLDGGLFAAGPRMTAVSTG